MDRSYSLKHHQRLRSRGSIRRLFESGKSGFVYPIRYMWFAEVAEEEVAEEEVIEEEVAEEEVTEHEVTEEEVAEEKVAKEEVASEEVSEEVIELTSEEVTEVVAEENIKILFTVPKRFHKRANKRNLLRRRVKESYRLHQHPLQEAATNPTTRYKSVDIALVYSTKESHSYKTIDRAVQKIIDIIAKEL